MSKPIITVVTATGAQGRSVVASFIASGQWHVRAITRNPSTPKALALAKLGAEIVPGDFQSPDDLKRAFTGAFAVYGVSIPPWHQAYIDTNHIAEYEQGRRQADAAKACGVQLFLWSTLPHVTNLTKGVCAAVEVYECKANVDKYLAHIDQPAIFISTPAFIDNVDLWPLYKLTGPDNIEFWNHVVKSDTSVPFLWVERDLGNLVFTLVNSWRSSPEAAATLNHTLVPIASWRGSWGAVAREIEKQTGMKTTHVTQRNVDERWHPDLTKAFAFQDTYGLYPGATFPPPAVAALGVNFGSLEEFVRVKVVPKVELKRKALRGSHSEERLS